MPPVLIDTNVLLYSIDPLAAHKQERALEVLRALIASNSGVLSVQNLAEFTNTALRRLQPPLSPAAALSQVSRLAETFRILDLTPAIVLQAARGVRDYRLSYYDAQLWACARLNQVPVVFSEDFAPNATLEGVTFINPFAPTFDLNAWL
jgi:predicted nucleic acid-binding protein